MKFQKANRKLKKLAERLGVPHRVIYSFDLPAGFTCPAANECKAFAVPNGHDNGYHIQDGPHTIFRCYAASDEVKYQSCRDGRWKNFDSLKAAGIRNVDAMTKAIQDALPVRARIVRIHTSGDFFTAEYLLAWLRVIRDNPDVRFYGYTKRADLLADRELPDNLNLVYSVGGIHDRLAMELGLQYCLVVNDPGDRDDLPIGDDEMNALTGSGSFRLLIHGTQPKGTEQARAAYRNARR